MNSVDYCVRKVKFPREEYDLCETIRKEATDGFKFKQLVSTIYEGSTESNAFLVFEKDAELIPTNVFFVNSDGEEVSDDILLTASKIDLIRKIGYIEINQVRYKIRQIIPCWHTDEDIFYCVIETEKSETEDDFVSQVE